MKVITGIITESTDYYCPKHAVCRITLDKDNYITAAHKLSDGAGTYLFNKYDRRHTKYVKLLSANLKVK